MLIFVTTLNKKKGRKKKKLTYKFLHKYTTVKYNKFCGKTINLDISFREENNLKTAKSSNNG